MRAQRAEAGYAMAVLLVSLSVMTVMLSVAMPVWKQMAQREKEAELIFRGQQYVRAIGLFQRRAGPGTLPPSLEVLVEQKFLRRQYKDPITGDDFVPLRQSPGGLAGPGGRGGGPPQAGGPQAGGRGQAQPPGPSIGRGTFQNQPGGVVGGIIGVASKSTAQSIRLYNGRDRYNEWEFVFVAQTQAPGAPGSPGAGPQPGQPGPGGRGRGFGPTPPGGPGAPGGAPPGGGFPPPPFPGQPPGGRGFGPTPQPPGR